MQTLLKGLGLAVALAGSMVGAVQAAPDDATRPQMLTLRYEFGGGQPQRFLANGVNLTPAGPLTLRAKEQDAGSGSSAAAVILAIGVALALVVLVAGDTAEDITDGKDDHRADNNACLPGTPEC